MIAGGRARLLRWPLVVGLVAAAVPAAAQPLVIADSRVDDVRGAVAVGRGYSAETNTVYGACVQNARDADDTSYDTDFQLRSLATAADIESLDRDGREFVRAQLKQLTRGGGRPLQALVATLSVRARVRALDESTESLMPEMAGLLERGRLSAFVSTCGSYFVRSLRRRSALYVLFTYEAAAADASFEDDVRTALSGFDLDEADSSAEVADGAKVSAAAMARDLRIVAWAIGLAAQPGGGIAFDLASYRRMVDHAFQAAQHDRVGVPIEMEVIPWLSHPAVIAKVLSSGARGDDIHALRQTITDSAERYLTLTAQIAEARAAATAAARCHLQLYRDAVVDGRVSAHLDGAYVKAHGPDPRRTLPLTALVAALTPQAVAAIEAQAEAYGLDLDSAGQPRSPLALCRQELERAELTVRHQSIPACTTPATPFSGEVLGTLAKVRTFCTPEIIPALPPTRAGG